MSAPSLSLGATRKKAHERGRGARGLFGLGCGALVVLGGVFLGLHALSVRSLSHDDAISLLAATAHQAAYEESAPAGGWVPAAAWQAFWTHDDESRSAGARRTIARDLAAYDIHPPLYFWLLHAWTLWLGVSLTAGPWLNVPLHLVVCLAITALCRRVGVPWPLAAAAGLLWLLSGSTLSIATHTRQYSLLGALSVLFVLALVALRQRQGTGRRSDLAAGAALAATCAAGLLTHYHFVLLVAAGAGVAALQLVLERPAETHRLRRLVGLGVPLALAGLVFVLLHPSFAASFGRQAEQAQAFGGSELAMRIAVTLSAGLELFVPRDVARPAATAVVRSWPLTLGACAVAFSAACWLVWRRRRAQDIVGRGGQETRGSRRDRPLSPAALPGFVAALCGGAVVALYLACVSPRHAMGARYLVLVSPLVFVVLAQALTALHRRHAARESPRTDWAVVAVVVLLASQALYGASSTLERLAAASRPANDPLRADVPLLLDSTARGVLPPVVWHADPSTPVFAAPQARLLAHGLPSPPSPEPSIVFVSDPRYGNTPAGSQEIVRALAGRGYRVLVPIETPLWPSPTVELRRSGL